MLVDAGSLALSSDPGCTHLANRAPGFGVVIGDSSLRVVGVTQEMGKVTSGSGQPIDFSKYPIGTVMRIVPNHSCLTAAMFSNYKVIKGGSTSISSTWTPDKFLADVSRHPIVYGRISFMLDTRGEQ
eukprot:gene18608-22268_t